MKLTRPRGTRDFLPDEMGKRRYVERTVRELFGTYGYREVETPVFEHLELFATKSGEQVVQQMYTFKDKGGRDLVLRPELTAPIIRMYIENFQKAPKPLKFYYVGPCFRYEEPQMGRWRQFYHIGVELIGSDEPEADAEVIALASKAIERIGLKNFEVHVGHLGVLRGILQEANVEEANQDKVMSLIDKGDVEGLKAHLEGLKLKPEDQKLLLKLIELCGQPGEVLNKAKQLLKNKTRALKALALFEQILEKLEIFDLKNYFVNLGIARGLEYYTGMVFEIYASGLGAQSQICGGGSYRLAELFGGETVGSTGFALGFDRIMEAVKIQNVTLPEDVRVKALIAPVAEEVRSEAIKIAQRLRESNIAVDLDLMRRKLSKILDYANAIKIPNVIIVGPKEIKQNKIVLRNMKTGSQEEVEINKIIEILK